MKRSAFFRCRTKCLATGELIDVLVLFFSHPLLDINVLDDEFQNALKSREPVPDAVALLSFGPTADRLRDVWVEHQARAKGLMERGKGADGMEYLKEVAVWKLHDGRFVKLFRDPTSKAEYNLDIPSLLSRGFAEQVDRLGVFQEAPPRHLFRHPSGRQSKQFFVASELLHDEVDAYFAAALVCVMAWVRLRSTTLLHIDTMGIYPIARAVADIAACTGGRPTPWEIESFHSHGGMHELYRVVQDHEAVLISATTSGSMAAKLVDEGVADVAVITLLDISDRDRKGSVVYARSRHPAAASQPEVFDDDIVIELTGEYFVARGKRPRPFALTRDHRPPSLGELLRHFSSDAHLRLNGLRNNGSGLVDLVSVDENAIVQCQAFKTWVAQEIRVKTPVSASHVVPVPGPGGMQMAEECAALVQAFKGSKPAVVPSQELHKLGPADVSGVLVCAPLLGDGHVMRSIARDLRELVPEASRHFLVGLGLPEARQGWTRLTQFLSQSGVKERPYPVSTWMTIATGAPAGRGAAWNKATLLMQRIDLLQIRADSPWHQQTVVESLEKLGLALEADDHGFLPTSQGSPLQLTRGFVYWDTSKEILDCSNHAAASLLAMSSALQLARDEPNARIRFASSIHEVVVLDPENFLRFNDGVLQASLLRAALPHELDYSGAPELSELVRELLEKIFINHERSYGEAALEFALALATDRLRLTRHDGATLIKRTARYCESASVLQGLLYCFWAGLAPEQANN